MKTWVGNNKDSDLYLPYFVLQYRYILWVIPRKLYKRRKLTWHKPTEELLLDHNLWAWATLVLALPYLSTASMGEANISV